MVETIAIVSAAGTVHLKSRAAAAALQLMLMDRELQQHECVRLAFNFDRSSMTTEITSIGRKYFDKQGVKNGNGNGA